MRLACSIALLALASIAAVTQSGVRDDSIAFGSVRLTLGQPQPSALETLRQRYEVRPIDQRGEFSSWSVWTRVKGELSSVGNVWFTAGTLSGASLGWITNQEDEQRAVSFASSLHGAVRELAGDVGRECRVSTGTVQGPGRESRSVFLQCGRKLVRIDVSKSEFGEFASISEVIGR